MGRMCKTTNILYARWIDFVHESPCWIGTHSGEGASDSKSVILTIPAQMPPTLVFDMYCFKIWLLLPFIARIYVV